MEAILPAMPPDRLALHIQRRLVDPAMPIWKHRRKGGSSGCVLPACLDGIFQRCVSREGGICSELSNSPIPRYASCRTVNSPCPLEGALNWSRRDGRIRLAQGGDDISFGKCRCDMSDLKHIMERSPSNSGRVAEGTVNTPGMGKCGQVKVCVEQHLANAPATSRCSQCIRRVFVRVG